MVRGKKSGPKRPIEFYEHKGKERANNPPVGLVTPDRPGRGAEEVRGHARSESREKACVRPIYSESAQIVYSPAKDTLIAATVSADNR